MKNRITEYVPYTKNVKVHVTENRAVTDESVRLFNELEEKARLNLIKNDFISNNLNISFSQFIINPVSNIYKIYIIFKLNDKEFKLEEDIMINKFHDNRDDLVKKIYNKISEFISLQILTETRKELHKFINNI